MLKVSDAATTAMHEHARAGYPFEICGFLVGVVEEDGVRVAREAWPVRNAWEDDPALRALMFADMQAAGGPASVDGWESASTERRFLVDPKDLLDTMKRARAAGMDLVGVYHTHPDHPAIPSEFDRSAAWPDWSYIILSVRSGDVAEVRSWVVQQEDGPFVEEPIQAL